MPAASALEHEGSDVALLIHDHEGLGPRARRDPVDGIRPVVHGDVEQNLAGGAGDGARPMR